MLFSLLLIAVGPIAPVEEIAETVEEILVTGTQERLQELGWYEGEVDGIFGPLTEAAIESFVGVADLDEVNPVTVLFAAHDEDAPEAPEPTSVAASSSPSSSTERSRGGVSPPRYGVGEPWATLAECESGNWIDGGASFATGSARWNWGAPGMTIPPWGTRIHHGGLQFHPGTWSAYRSDHHPTYAYDASPSQQVEVAERVLADQTWRAWPTCSQKIGLR